MGIARLKKCTNTLSQSVSSSIVFCGVMDVKRLTMKMIWGRRIHWLYQNLKFGVFHKSTWMVFGEQ